MRNPVFAGKKPESAAAIFRQNYRQVLIEGGLPAENADKIEASLASIDKARSAYAQKEAMKQVFGRLLKVSAVSAGGYGVYKAGEDIAKVVGAGRD